MRGGNLRFVLPGLGQDLEKYMYIIVYIYISIMNIF